MKSYKLKTLVLPQLKHVFQQLPHQILIESISDAIFFDKSAVTWPSRLPFWQANCTVGMACRCRKLKTH